MKQNDQTQDTPTQEKRPPTQPLSFVYADCKEQISVAVKKIVNGYGMPLFMVEGMLESLLSEFRHEAYMELAADSVQYKFALDEYYSGQIAQMQEEHDKQIAEMVAGFEAQGQPPEPPKKAQ